MVVLYGIKNCDTVKKACKFLDNQSVNYQFHDFRSDGLEAKQIDTWIKDLGIETLVNKRSRTWKELSDAQRSSLETAKASATIAKNPTLIKRPLLEFGKSKSSIKRLVGFDQKQYLALFS